MARIKQILVANRGEIAVRVMRTAKTLGYRTTAVYSETDRDAPHVELADDAVLIGPPPASESYLNCERILAAAKHTGADAVHPGYGFLSENADFARACEAAGLVFIGPTPDAIELMGNKAAAKRRMIEAGVPCIPGYEGTQPSEGQFQCAADEIGYPVMVKAAAGGGGRGLRRVDSKRRLSEALRLARSEAENAFGSGELILEKAILRPRHVEVQVFADTHGNVIHLGERDCSLQRRHQKVIEESPCPIMTPELRERMGAAAVEAARSISYRSAGTVEFLLDADGRFYFLEMNTRLQVEHPVTEMVTGLDLVAMQIRVAEGEELGIDQADVRLSGHAIEARLYAEDPAQGFLPSTGRVHSWRPATGEGIRVDCGIRAGEEISPFYDPLVAKVVAFGESRAVARRRLIDALEASVLFGPRTNSAFLIDCLANPRFAEQGATTAFIEEDLAQEALQEPLPGDDQVSAVAALHYQLDRDDAYRRSVTVAAPLMNWSTMGTLHTDYRYTLAGTTFDVTVSPTSATSYRVRCGDHERAVVVRDVAEGSARFRVDDRGCSVLFYVPRAGEIWASVAGRSFLFRNALALAAGAEEDAGAGKVTAPMHGKVLDIFVDEGRAVDVGDRLAVMEAMKMQHELVAETAGIVREILAAVGQQVAAGDVLFRIEVSDG